jgi:hypothetical protein
MGSRSARPPRTVIKDVSANGSASERNYPPASSMRLTMAKKVEGRAGEAVYSRHGHHVTGSEIFHLGGHFCWPKYAAVRQGI